MREWLVAATIGCARVGEKSCCSTQSEMSSAENVRMGAGGRGLDAGAARQYGLQLPLGYLILWIAGRGSESGDGKRILRRSHVQRLKRP